MNDSTQEEGSNGAERKRTRRRTLAPSTTPRLDRLPPHSIEAEQGVLGSILLCPGEAVSEAIEKLKGDEVFYDLRHQTIFNVLVTMYDSREPIDLITLPQRLRDTMVLDQVGGLDYLSSLPDKSPSAANIGYYAEIVREKYLLRRVVQLCTGVVTRVFEEEQDVDALLDEVERDILKVSQSRVSEKKMEIADLVKAAITQIEDFHLRQGMLSGVATGFRQLDKMTTGLHGGEMIVIAARPSMGKTSLAMNIAEYVAVEQQQPVGVFSLEMTADSLVLRMLCSRSKVNMRNVREGFLADRDFPKLTGAASKLSSAPIFIDDSSGLSILQLRAKARRMHQQHHIKLFVIDY
ncbi:MAG: replicative DNA helicase, partial [Verrucomicrobiota bacterium]